MVVCTNLSRLYQQSKSCHVLHISRHSPIAFNHDRDDRGEWDQVLTDRRNHSILCVYTICPLVRLYYVCICTTRFVLQMITWLPLCSRLWLEITCSMHSQFMGKFLNHVISTTLPSWKCFVMYRRVKTVLWSHNLYFNDIHLLMTYLCVVYEVRSSLWITKIILTSKQSCAALSPPLNLLTVWRYINVFHFIYYWWVTRC